jgi:uncharacterized protein (DUF433 family)
VTHDRIEKDPAIMFGKPVIKGTRITVEHILRKLAAGMTIDHILVHHPHLTPDDIHAAAAGRIAAKKRPLLRPESTDERLFAAEAAESSERAGSCHSERSEESPWRSDGDSSPPSATLSTDRSEGRH